MYEKIKRVVKKTTQWCYRNHKKRVAKKMYRDVLKAIEQCRKEYDKNWAQGVGLYNGKLAVTRPSFLKKEKELEHLSCRLKSIFPVSKLCSSSTEKIK